MQTDLRGGDRALREEERIFLVVWILNFLIAILYFLWGTQILEPV